MKRTKLAIEDKRRFIQAPYFPGIDQLDHERYLQRHITFYSEHIRVETFRSLSGFACTLIPPYECIHIAFYSLLNEEAIPNFQSWFCTLADTDYT